MSDDEYTPTTDEVRERFSLVQCGGTYGPHEMRPAVKYRERFDRWLAAHDESVRGAERERIAQAVTVAASEAPVMMHLNEYPSQAVPKAELLALAARIVCGVRADG